MKYYNLQYYVDKLKKGEKFSLARFGDGEMLCMWGKQGENSNGCRYSPELRQALLDSMKHKDDPTFIYGMQRVLPQDKEKAEKDWPVDWHDSEFFSEAVAEGKLYPFIETLKDKDICFVINESLEPFLSQNFKGNNVDVIVPKSNAFEEKDRVINIIKNGMIPRQIYLFSCGMAANVFISELHGKIDGWLIDVGHIWDPFVGNMSRCDLEGKTLQDIEKNLKPWLDQ